MALPNYSPSGKILFGSVPWDSGYSNVRLYTSLEEQYNDIATRMTLSSDNYTYIGRNRRLKVAIEADRLYHCNYCMYRNESLTDGYIYCFVSDVKYINDRTSEITIETDVFQTYLYGTDWQIPACFIERETTPSEDSKYMLSEEPSFPLVYVGDGVSRKTFGVGGFIVMTSAKPEKNNNLIEDIVNPQGYYAKPIAMTFNKGIACGCALYYFPVQTSAGGSENMEAFLNELTFAGSVESIVAIFTVPSFAASLCGSGGRVNTQGGTDIELSSQTDLSIPANKNTLDGYTPRNAKLHYYPYSFAELGDGQGQRVQLRYELMNETTNVRVKYALNPLCQAFAFPYNYRGIALDYDDGIVVKAGAMGSWTNNAFQNWVGQNSGTIALTVAGVALAGISGGTTLAAASAELEGLGAMEGFAHVNEADLAAKVAGQMGNVGKSSKTLKRAGAAGAGGVAGMVNASKQPTTTRGQVNGETLFSTGAQGLFINRICAKAEVAQQIDQFFDRWGYAVERIEAVNITSRPSWNYVKTGGATPRSLNAGAGATAPFTRGRGTPADALDVIRRAFDGGITFWHNTATFGDYSQSNALG